MSYRIRLTGGEDLKVDNKTGEKLRNMIETGKREGFFQVGTDLYMAKDVKAVVFLGEEINLDAKRTEEYEKFDKGYNEKLEKWSQEDAKTKAIRNVSVRIRHLAKFITPIRPLSEVGKMLSEWFSEHPEYPWSPVSVWLEFAFGKKENYPYYLNVIARHESRVNRWLEEFKLVPVVTQKSEDLIEEYMGIGGDLGD